MPLRDIEAQPHAVESLRRAIRGGRLHHAYLFAGPDGVGKGLTAQAVAEALLCTAPRDDGDACGECKSCRRVSQRKHPDLHVVERLSKSDGSLENVIKIAQVRELQKALSFKSFEGARRVVLIFEPEAMNPATANALLKTLEEPGADTHFVLVSASPHTLLPTILSRCQRVRFNPLPRAFVAQKLAELLELEPAHADLLAGLAEGSIGKGASLAESPLFTRRVELIEKLDDPAGLYNVQGVLDAADVLAKRKEELPLLFHMLRTWYRDVVIAQQGLPDDRLVHRDLASRVRARAAELRFDDVAARIERVNETEEAIFGRNANARLALETCFLALVGKRRAA